MVEGEQGVRRVAVDQLAIGCQAVPDASAPGTGSGGRGTIAMWPTVSTRPRGSRSGAA